MNRRDAEGTEAPMNSQKPKRRLAWTRRTVRCVACGRHYLARYNMRWPLSKFACHCGGGLQEDKP